MTIQYTDEYCDIMTHWLDKCCTVTVRTLDNDIEIFNMQEHCFHYTSLESFWKIIESDTFRATHVRFSNDMQEYKCGEDIIERIIGSKNLRKENYYVICFCSDGDLLSQWREYGKVGVSIEMDFGRQSLFSINSKTSFIDYKMIFSYPVNVLYVNKGNTIKNEDFYRSEKVFSYESLKMSYEASPAHGRDEDFRSIIPYIKHGAFIEEKESRLLFSMPPGEEDQEKKYVQYTDPAPFKKPYLEVKYGDKNESNRPCTYIHVSELAGSNVENIVKTWLINYNKSRGKAILFRSETLYENNVNKYSQIYISAGTEQEELLYCIEDACSKLTPQPKIWCDGYWPVRSIMVGPTLDKDQIRESIDHYCKSKYWLKSVDVTATDTPYREKRN